MRYPENDGFSLQSALKCRMDAKYDVGSVLD